ncbi:MAG: short-chain dehydrogenase [Gammaproteobacteria bacterium]|jgi:NAD(P)-dependent dehydrogenase (short-subunit alcohol dehydrogenase family)|nr:short-chain dehydrogenase [Gammaproteobacteria bacterium]|tara:strand:- start:314 stop:1003 length:690 start_codon:yes stop_codon:yes gene_type:complete
MTNPVCVIVGIGPKNGAAFARCFDRAGYRIALLSRTRSFSEGLAEELSEARAYTCDAAEPASVESAFAQVRSDLGVVDVLIYNAGNGSWKDVEEITPEEFEQGWRVNSLGALVSSQLIIPDMKAQAAGNIIFVGATASLRGRPNTAGFASAKAAQRSLAQSMAKHLGPQGIHVSLLIIDGGIDLPGATNAEQGKRLDPDDIATLAYYLTTQPRSAWTFEVDVRPNQENW